MAEFVKKEELDNIVVVKPSFELWFYPLVGCPMQASLELV